ncbi:MAG: transglutaminaseTgpA domain-containing protein [Helicobacteraceae bacterium]|jgi:transglutaminase-like putative cysteine protease|nr:transglutaminaseTgpA domain-containing protein [Helicobacteraceae bacterium]
MRFSPTLPSIKSPPKSLHLVDIALFLSILPHLERLKFPMLVYLLVVFIVLVIKRELSKPLQYGLMFFGLLSVISSFYTDFNFSSFSKFALYLSFLNALLIYAVTLQRMKGELNFYLAFSPAMLLMLSFFLHNSIVMLFYMVFTLFIFLLLFVWHKMNNSLNDVLKISLSIFAYSLPVVALLFLVFPRISFEKADYGFRDELVKRSGHNGQMSLGSDALMVPSPQVIMEVYFDEKLPQGRDLYFRGTTLYVDSNDSFRQLKNLDKEPLNSKNRAVGLSESVGYKVTLYPHNEKWLYSIDVPDYAPEKSTLFDDYTLVSNEKIEKVYRYALRSYLSYKMNAPLSTQIREASLKVNEDRDKVSAEIAKSLIASSDKETLNNLMDYFQSLNLVYTLKPDPFDRERPIDSFLQESKKGYCVHFAAAFTYMARVAKLPTRVVTGFMVNTDDALDNYLVVREYSAHAWVEVYLNTQGWTRVETTSFAKRYAADTLQNLDNSNLSQTEKFLRYTNLRFMYVKYVIETWILEYSRVKQMEVLHNLLNNTIYLVKFMLFTLLFVALSVVLALFVNTQRCRDRLLCLMTPFFKKAKKEGFVKEPNESMHDFFNRLKRVYDRDAMDKIDSVYHIIKYAEKYSEEDTEKLKDLLKTVSIKMK